MRSAIALAAALAVAAPARGSQPLTAPEIEESTALARRGAEALARRSPEALSGIFDENALVSAAAGPSLAPRLTARQRRAIADRMLEWFAGPFSARPASARPSIALGSRSDGDDAVVALLVAVSSGYLKTEWRIHPAGAEGRVEDVRLSDLGRSLLREAVESLGPPPVARLRDRAAEARRAAWPRAAGFFAVLVVAAIFARRARPRERLVVLVAALAPAVLFAADGYLAVSRIWQEPVEIRLAEGPPWGHAFQRFQLAVSRRNRQTARAAAGEAISLGARPQPFHLVLGRLAEDAGDAKEAASFYSRAALPPTPAPGGWAGLARLDSTAGRDAEAVEEWKRYFAAVPPDPSSYFWLAAAQGHLQDFEGAQDALAHAIALDPSEPELYALSARLYGAAGDAPNAISRLRDEEKLRPIDRASIAADGNFAAIADDASWKAFLAEKGANPGPEPPSPDR